MIETVAGSGVGGHHFAADGDEVRVWKLLADPIGGRVDVDLNDQLQSDLLRQIGELVEVVEAILPRTRLGAGPVDPGSDAVESEGFDLAEIVAPGVAMRLRIGIEHRRTHLPTAVPHRHRKDVLLEHRHPCLYPCAEHKQECLCHKRETHAAFYSGDG